MRTRPAISFQSFLYAGHLVAIPSPGTQVRPALCVVPMGWHSAVALVQEAVSTLVFERAKIPRQFSIEKHSRLPEEKICTIVYLDNFDEIHVVKTLDIELRREGAELSPHHSQFIAACNEAMRQACQQTWASS